jgi:hypothetical protein
VAKSPALAAYDYPGWCRLGFVDLGSFTLTGKMSWEAGCFGGQAAWSIPDPASDRFAVRVATLYKDAPKREELLLASYQSRKVLCRVAAANDAAFGADGDLYAAQDDGQSHATISTAGRSRLIACIKVPSSRSLY